MIHRYVSRDRKKSISQEQLYSVLRYPIVTEKSTLGREKNQYFFTVAPWANKMFIKKAVETIFGVDVKKINTLCLKGKTRRFRGKLGSLSDVKKDMVVIADGQVLDFEKGKTV
jgi:large subunit ribosomal protein L23